MDANKRKKLQKAGWRIGSAADLLGLSSEEQAIVTMKLALADQVRLRRLRGGLTQVSLARRLRTSQSRVAKMEAADPSVSLDLLIRSLLALGASPRDVSRAIATRQRPAA